MADDIQNRINFKDIIYKELKSLLKTRDVKRYIAVNEVFKQYFVLTDIPEEKNNVRSRRHKSKNPNKTTHRS